VSFCILNILIYVSTPIALMPTSPEPNCCASGLKPNMHGMMILRKTTHTHTHTHIKEHKHTKETVCNSIHRAASGVEEGSKLDRNDSMHTIPRWPSPGRHH